MEDKKEFTFEDLFVKVVQGMYWLYFGMGIIGILFFIVHLNKLLLVETILLSILFLFQYGFHLLNSFFGILWLVCGGIIGYVLFKTSMAICLGMNVAVVIRHIVKKLYFKIVYKGIDTLNKL